MAVLDSLKRYFHRIYERYKSQREGRTRTVFTVNHDMNGVAISSLTTENATRDTTFLWRDVLRIDAFKRDLYTVDVICLAFVLSDDTEVEIDEDMKGFPSLVQKLPEYVPGCQTWDQWFRPVAVPAFELNLTTIYQKER